MTSNITLSLKINTTKNRHTETTKKTTKDCTHTTNNMIHPKTNYKHSTNLYKIHDFELDKTKNTINKLQFDKHFVKEKAWKKTQIEIENNEKYGSIYDYYQQKYNNLPDLNCPLCNNKHESTEHIFTQCPKTKHIHAKLLKKMKSLLKEGIWRSSHEIHNNAGKLYIPMKDKTKEWKLAQDLKHKMNKEIKEEINKIKNTKSFKKNKETIKNSIINTITEKYNKTNTIPTYQGNEWATIDIFKFK